MKRLIPIFIHLFVFFNVFTHWSLQAQDQQKPPIAVNGVMDLRHWDFDRNGSIDLSGEWLFYWQQLLSPQDLDSESLAEKTGILSLPAYWDSFKISDISLPGEGYATFVLTLLLPEEQGNLAFLIKDIQTAYLLYANGEKIIAVGTVGTDKDSTVPRYSPTIVGFSPQNRELTLVLQVANFHHRQGGVFGN